MDAAAEARARIAALREYELARLVDDGDVADGLCICRVPRLKVSDLD